jgi:polysaccharide deacetylase family protein (PEP-CTERM system associated)
VAGNNGMKANILSFDVEEWFQVANFQKYIPTSRWESMESRVQIGIDFILDALDSSNTKATFFLIGWVAERHPEMVKAIDEKGHELGIHGYMHRSITEQTPQMFAEDIQRSIEVVSEITGKHPKGYRAPSYTITPATVWALDILKDHGIEYDSSIYPIKGHPIYGFPGAPSYPFQFKNGLYEFPMSTFQIGPAVVPFASGAYFRLFPYPVTHLIMKSLNNNSKFLTVNFHPWELDPDQKVLDGIHRRDRFKHYVNLATNRRKFVKLLSRFNFTTFSEFIEHSKFPRIELNNGSFKFL